MTIQKLTKTQIGSKIPKGTADSVLYLDSNGKLAESNPGFTFDGTDLVLAGDVTALNVLPAGAGFIGAALDFWTASFITSMVGSTLLTTSIITAGGIINANGGIASNDVTDTAWGIQNQNLVDKTDAETISGSWDFSTTPLFSALTQGSVLFAGAGGQISENNDDFMWDETNDTLQLGETGTEKTIIISGVEYKSHLKVNEQEDANLAMLQLHKHSTTDVLGATLIASRSNSSGTGHGVVTDGQNLLRLVGAGWTDEDYDIAAQITFDVDGDAGADDMPGSISFWTTPDGSNTSLEALKIGQDQIATFFANPVISTTAPSLTFTDTTASAKGFTIKADSDLMTFSSDDGLGKGETTFDFDRPIRLQPNMTDFNFSEGAPGFGSAKPILDFSPVFTVPSEIIIASNTTYINMAPVITNTEHIIQRAFVLNASPEITNGLISFAQFTLFNVMPVMTGNNSACASITPLFFQSEQHVNGSGTKNFAGGAPYIGWLHEPSFFAEDTVTANFTNIVLQTHSPKFIKAAGATLNCTNLKYLTMSPGSTTAGTNITNMDYITMTDASIPTNLSGIVSNLSDGGATHFFIEHTGAARSIFGGEISINVDTTKLSMGAGGSIDSYLEFDGANLDIFSNAAIDLMTATDTDLVLNFIGTTNSGVLTWLEDEDRFEVGDDIQIDFNTIFDPSAVTNITAGGGITVTNTQMKIQGSGGAVIITANPQIAAGIDGQLLVIHGQSNSNTVTLTDGNGVHLHSGKIVTFGQHDYMTLNYASNVSEWQEVSSSFPSSEKSWAFASPTGASGTFYSGGYYDFGATDNDFNPSITFGTANGSYAAHFFLVQAAGGAGGTDTVIRITGTSIDDQGNRSAADTEDLTMDDVGSAGDYNETSKKWIGQITVVNLSGPDLLCNYGFAKYWDSNNSDFRVVGVEVTGRGGATDAAPNFILRHHKSTGWTYNNGSTPTPPSALTDMNTDHNTEISIINGDNFAWKRDDLSTVINGGNGEGTIIEWVTSANKAIETANFMVRIRPV